MKLNNPEYVGLLLSKLGIKVYEGFRLVYADNGMLHDKRKFYIDYVGDLFDDDGFERNILIPYILLGQLIVVKLPFKPEYEEEYQFVEPSGNVLVTLWWGYSVDYYRFNAKNCFPINYKITPKDIERILNEMKGNYHND